MRKARSAADPEAYIDGQYGWQRDCVEGLRAAVRRAGPLEEAVKWGHLVYFSNGSVALIRAEAPRVLFGFWRGKRLVEIAPGLGPGGKYEMATIQIGGDGDQFRTGYAPDASSSCAQRDAARPDQGHPQTVDLSQIFVSYGRGSFLLTPMPLGER